MAGGALCPGPFFTEHLLFFIDDHTRCEGGVLTPRATFAASAAGLPPPKMANEESKPIGRRNGRNTPPSHKHCTIKRRGHVEMSERKRYTFAN